MNLYPPILESQRISIQEGALPAGTYFEIPFTMPLSTNTAEIKHVQVLIRKQANMEPWCSQTRTRSCPDKETIFLDRSMIRDANRQVLSATSDLSICYLYIEPVNIRTSKFSGPGFDAGSSQSGETYTIQIRFGQSSLTYANDAKDFASWKRTQIVGSLFGEWSNTQRMYCHAPFKFNTNWDTTPTNDKNPIAEINWDYIPVSNDPIAQVRVQYSWSTPDDDAYGNMFRAYNVDFISNDSRGASASGQIETGVMRFSKLNVVLTLTTINNTIGQKIFSIPTFGFAGSAGSSGTIKAVPVEGEEIEDGVLAVKIGWPVGANNMNHYHKIHRVNLRTIEAVLITTIPPQTTQGQFETILKDYSVEMGEEYVYFGAGYKGEDYDYPLIWDNNLLPNSWKPHLYPGYARQMDFQGNTFLTTKWAQLNLRGNVQISSFQRNTSDQFTTTIGGAYPFYSRSAQFNYRTLSLQGLITLNFDATNTFLRFRTQLVTPAMRVAAGKPDDALPPYNTASAYGRYAKAVSLIGQNDPNRNLKIDAALNQYYYELELIYKGIDPLTKKEFTGLPNKPLWMTGQLWQRENQDNESLVLRDTELFSDFQFSNSGVRTQHDSDPNSQFLERKDAFDISSPNRNNERQLRGPTSIFDDRKLRDATHVKDAYRPNDIIYAERKFREAVMKWMSDGKPKLFRSETEGNMIVILSGVSFTPFNKSRQVYNLSCTVTEVAEYNLINLVKYGLVPVKFESFYPPVNEYTPVYGDKD